MQSIENTPTAGRRASTAQHLAAGTMRELSDTELSLVGGAWSGYAFGFPGSASGHSGGMVPGGSPIHAYASYTDPLYAPSAPTGGWYGADLNAWKNAP